MDSSNVSEDGASERVRFDNTIYYAIDKESIDKVFYEEILYISKLPLTEYFVFRFQDIISADKASMISDRSFKICGDDMDSASLSSNHKRSTFANRLPPLLPQQHRNVSLDSQTNNIPEVDDQMAEHTINMTALKDCSAIEGSNSIEQQPLPPQNKSSLNIHSPLLVPTESNEPSKQTISNSADATSSQPTKNLSKAAVLRQLFFSQINVGSNTSNDTPSTAQNKQQSSTPNDVVPITVSTKLSGSRPNFEPRNH